METISILVFIAICLIYIALISFCAYYCSDFRKPFFWEKENRMLETTNVMVSNFLIFKIIDWSRIKVIIEVRRLKVQKENL